MLKSVQWDIYTIIMIALVPAMLLIAWGIDTWESDQLHKRQCEMAVDWLESSAGYADQFERSGTTGNTELWINRIEQLDSPNAAGDLRWGILQSANYHAEYFPDLPTDAPGVLNPKNGLLERQIHDGAERLIEHCPDTEDLIPAAFPMVFKEDER